MKENSVKKKSVVIKINTVIAYEDSEREKICEEHQGEYYEKSTYNYLNYKEQDPATEQIITTTIYWQNCEPLQVIVLRQGAANAKNIFQEGSIDYSTYKTEEGEINIETATEGVEFYNDNTGGRILASYYLKMNKHLIGEYELTISYNFCK